MIHNTKRQNSILLLPGSLAILVLASLLLLSNCDNRYRTFSLVLEDIDYSGSGSLFVAVNNQPEIFGSFLSYGVTIEPGQTAARIDDIQWDNYKNDADNDSAWLLVAEDTINNGTLNEGDQLIPAMRILLPREQDEIIIRGLRFNSAENTVPLLFPDARIFGLSIFISDPGLVTPNNPIYLFCDENLVMDLLIPSLARSATFIFNSADLIRHMVVRINQPASPHVLAWWDADGSGNLSPGDWISSLATQAQNMDDDRAALILSPMLTY